MLGTPPTLREIKSKGRPCGMQPPQGASRQEAATPTYVIECFWPGITADAAKEALAGIANAQKDAATSNHVRPLACILVPSDGMALFLISGPSLADVRQAAELIQLPFDRIVESLPIVLGSTASDK
jgi:hypothetical protein